MTSNIGSRHLIEGIDESGEIPGALRTRVLAELRAHFRPEFLNRIDEQLLFRPLTPVEIESIVDILAARLGERLAERNVGLEITREARTLIAELGYDPVYGARPLARVMKRELETPIGRLLIGGELGEGRSLRVDVMNGGLQVSVAEVAPRAATP